ncbi:MAG: hypothetical protein CVT96_03790 [Bacteroidetes bacterium HGW-Bacteroidetes-13]|nr:MAG: hypothetical protein CVT96_03790 [Bacteroidetes bacterium HGW-Bacteroidetes-13]
MNEEINLEKLKKLMTHTFGVGDVSLDTKVNELNTLSEDNEHFIKLFQNEFNVNMESFSYYEYFEEDEFILLSVLKRIFPMIRKKKKPLKVKHLLSVIRNGKWFDP